MASLDDVLAELSSSSKRPTARTAATKTQQTKGGRRMDYETESVARTARAEERARIRQIMAHPEAKGREGHALKLALDSDMDVGAVASMLTGFPHAASNIPSIEQRATEQREIGSAAPQGTGTSAEAAKAGWAAAIDRYNKSTGL